MVADNIAAQVRAHLGLARHHSAYAPASRELDDVPG
jgi:hypothetical protein